jgi:Family of unknown function (DUF6327)
MSKKYSSYDQINAELEILKLEKEIHLQHILLNLEKTKETFQLKNLLHEALDSCKSIISSSYSTILQIAIPYVINWLINKKRGN